MSQTEAVQRGSDNLISSKLERSFLWKVKTRLQWSGWMQYLPNVVLTVVFLLLAGLGSLLSSLSGLFSAIPLTIAGLLFANLLFDLLTVKAGIRPSEALPTPRTELDAFDLMRSRRSCRSFQKRKLTEEHRQELLKKVEEYTCPEHLVGERQIRLEYIAAPLTVWPVVGAQEFFVAIAPKPYHRQAIINVGRSLQKVVIHATKMGLGTCWIGPGADQSSIAVQLGERFNTEEEHIICVCAIGYESWFKPLMIRAMQRVQRRRLPLSSLFFADSRFEEAMDTQQAPFSAYGRCYEVCQWSPSSFNSQTTRCGAVVNSHDGQQKVTRFDFGANTASRYYAPVAVGIWCANWETGCEALGQKGHFQVLTAEERGVESPPELPRYDISWVVEEGM